MKEAIRQRAQELGFDACRFTTADPPASAPQLRRWLDAQRHGQMGYLERNAFKRMDPQRVLPGARSIITVAVSYALAERRARTGARRTGIPSAGGDDSLLGEVARYARFDDYHDVFGPRLKTLSDYVDETGGIGTRSLWYVDTGPVLERDFAQRAGLGFVGKHTGVISRQFGNWILLGEIFTTMVLEPDLPEKNRCGSCTRCLAACPTRAITAPFELDARRCISYLTIELKGPIPLELRPAVGNRIFGCDDCLAACPWNRFAREGNLMKRHVRVELATQNLTELLGLDEADFKARFAGTPIWRAKLRGLRRNVCVALGNSADTSALSPLQHAARDSDPLVAAHAQWAVDQIRSRLNL
jgi:epoxyqueuosine reductase